MRDNFLIHENYVRDKVESSPLEKFIKQSNHQLPFLPLILLRQISLEIHHLHWIINFHNHPSIEQHKDGF